MAGLFALERCNCVKLADIKIPPYYQVRSGSDFILMNNRPRTSFALSTGVLLRVGEFRLKRSDD